MNLLEEIKKCESSNLPDDIKQIRLRIFETIIKKNDIENQIDQLVKRYINMGLENREILNFQISSNIDEDIVILKQCLLHIPEVQELERQNITYKMIELKRYNNEVINKIVDMYEILSKIKKLYNQLNIEIVNGLSVMVGPNVLSNETMTISNADNKIMQKKVKKSKIELEEDKSKCIAILNNNHNVLDDEVYNLSLNLLLELFDNYNKKEIIIDINKQKVN